jgi:hypothetical protein
MFTNEPRGMLTIPSVQLNKLSAQLGVPQSENFVLQDSSSHSEEQPVEVPQRTKEDDTRVHSSSTA